MKTPITIIITAGIAVACAVSPVFAQLSAGDVRARLDLVHAGKIDHVRTEVAGMMKQSPNDPGVRFLDAYVTENGDQAVKKYQSFVDTYPDNEWADDALYKVYQYYYAVGLYRTADAKREQLNRQYPQSIFAQQKEAATPSAPAPAEAAPATTKEPELRTPLPKAAADGPFAVQVGVYSQENKAREQADQLSGTTGRTAFVFEKQSGGKKVFAVAFGGFPDETAAKEFGAELRSKFNLDWFVVKR